MVSRRRATALKMFMISLVSMGVITGVYSADSLRPFIGTLWCAFLITASSFLILARLERKDSNFKDGT